MKTRYEFGGDEHLFIEIASEMSLRAFFASHSLARAVQQQKWPGVEEICPSNASLQIKFDPDLLPPQQLQQQVEGLERKDKKDKNRLHTRLIEVPVYYQDPWTHETLMRFRERHQAPDKTDLEYAAASNGFPSVAEFIAAHAAAPWFVSMVGFVAGLPFMYQMVERQRQLEVPKYLRPRTDTPRLTVGYGGCFSCIYSVRGAGGYQMFGITPMPIYDPAQKIRHLRDFMVFFRPGDIVKFKPIDRAAYETIVQEVEAGRFVPRVQAAVFDLEAFESDTEGYNSRLLEEFYGA